MSAPQTPGFPADYNPNNSPGVYNGTDQLSSQRGGQNTNVFSSAAAPARDTSAISALPQGFADIKTRQNTRNPFDLSTPGAGEQFYDQNKSGYTNPSNGQQWWGANSGQLQQPGMGESYSKNVLSQYGNGGALPENPGLDPYYKNSWRKASEDINQQLAARGLYGSSSAGDMLTEARTNLAADQASKEAQYALQRSQNQLGWAQGLGNIANNGENAAMGRFDRGFGGANALDSANLSRLNAGMGAGSTAQQLQQGRAQQLFGNEMNMAIATSGLANGTYGDLLGTDTGLLNTELGARNAAAAQKRQGSGDLFDSLIDGGIGLTKAYLNSQTGGATSATGITNDSEETRRNNAAGL